MSAPTATPATTRATLPRPVAAPSYASLRRRERATFRALNEVFRTLQLLDKAGCDDATYVQVSPTGRQVPVVVPRGGRDFGWEAETLPGGARSCGLGMASDR